MTAEQIRWLREAYHAPEPAPSLDEIRERAERRLYEPCDDWRVDAGKMGRALQVARARR